MPQPKDKDWLNGYKNKTPIYAVYKRSTSKQGTHRLKVKGWKKIFYANRDQKKAGVAILISDKIDFEIKAVRRHKEGHYIMIKGSIQEEDITIINIYAPNSPGKSTGVGCHFLLQGIIPSQGLNLDVLHCRQIL